ncbi:MAG TPA: hypothetical protein VGW78_01370 [Candidatus Babeliales bacterium]|jgi:hypothetical protein|nr:hypothetical protein [Candidatus Babeliales bacterium]
MNLRYIYAGVWLLTSVYTSVLSITWEIEDIQTPTLWQKIVSKALGTYPTIVLLRPKYGYAEELLNPATIKEREKEIIQKAQDQLKNNLNIIQIQGPMLFKIDYDYLQKKFNKKQKEEVSFAHTYMGLLSIIDDIFYPNGLFFTDVLLRDLYTAITSKKLAITSSYLLPTNFGIVQYPGFRQEDSPAGLIVTADGVDNEGYLLFSGPLRGYIAREMRKFNAAIGWKKTIDRQLKEFKTILLKSSSTETEEYGLLLRYISDLVNIIIKEFDKILTTEAYSSSDIAFASDYYIPDENTYYWLVPGAYNRLDQNTYNAIRNSWYTISKKYHESFKRLKNHLDEIIKKGAL